MSDWIKMLDVRIQRKSPPHNIQLGFIRFWREPQPLFFVNTPSILLRPDKYYIKFKFLSYLITIFFFIIFVNHRNNISALKTIKFHLSNLLHHQQKRTDIVLHCYRCNDQRYFFKYHFKLRVIYVMEGSASC